jgi:hypothetical protein
MDSFFFYAQILLGVLALACATCALCFLLTALKRRQKSHLRDAALPAAIAIGIYLLSFPFYYIEDRVSNHATFGAFATLSEPIFGHYSERTFQGDGYSITVYPLPAAIRRRFEKPDQKFLETFPKLPSYRSHWDTEHWRRGPVDPRFKAYLDFALTPSFEPFAPDQFSAIRAALQRPTTYYSFFKYDHGDSPGNIDLFIVDLENARVYIINFNT